MGAQGRGGATWLVEPAILREVRCVFRGLAAETTLFGAEPLVPTRWARRTREIGVRVALGGGRADVLRLVCGKVRCWACCKIATGLGVAQNGIRALLAKGDGYFCLWSRRR